MAGLHCTFVVLCIMICGLEMLIYRKRFAIVQHDTLFHNNNNNNNNNSNNNTVILIIIINFI